MAAATFFLASRRRDFASKINNCRKKDNLFKSDFIYNSHFVYSQMKYALACLCHELQSRCMCYSTLCFGRLRMIKCKMTATITTTTATKK